MMGQTMVVVTFVVEGFIHPLILLAIIPAIILAIIISILLRHLLPCFLQNQAFCTTAMPIPCSWVLDLGVVYMSVPSYARQFHPALAVRAPFLSWCKILLILVDLLVVRLAGVVGVEI
jgi:hypothetical protein